MSERKSESNWRTVQAYLSTGSEPAIFEVDFHTVEGTVRCSCPGFRVRKRCKHAAEVSDVIEQNNGEYPLELARTVTREQEREALRDARTWRTLVLRHAQPRVYGRESVKR